MALAVFVAAGCGSNKKAEQFSALPFPDITIPAMIQDRQEAAAYMVERYWDRLTDPERSFPSDSVLVSGVLKEDVEQKFANWATMLDMVSYDIAEKAVSRLCSRSLACERKDTTSTVLETVAALADKYLYDPNSPYRNEEHYLHFARILSSYEGFPSELRSKYAYQAQLCSLNRIGAKAADFRFTDRYGRMHTLYGIDAPYTLLFFSNPGCEACMGIIEMLRNEQKISEMIAAGRLAVLNIYIDEDIAAWRDYMSIYPEDWYNGFDPDLVIRTDNLYSVRAIPSLYLLGKGKEVILKDVPEGKLISYIVNNN